VMRFILRLLLIIAVGAYLCQHYWPLLRVQIPRLASGNSKWLDQVPSVVNSSFPKRPDVRSVPLEYLPRRDLTPGAIDRHVRQANVAITICRTGYARSVRPPFQYTNRIKHRVMRTYGATRSIHEYELDHLIPLELGGCPDCETNLWPEPRNVFPGAKEKDEVEDYLHHKVCAGAISLAEAQHEIASDWYAVYKRIHKGN